GLHVGERLIARGAGPGRLGAGAGALQVRGRPGGPGGEKDLGGVCGGAAAGQLLLDRCTALLDDDETDRLRAAGPTASADLRSALSIAIAASGQQARAKNDGKICAEGPQEGGW